MSSSRFPGKVLAPFLGTPIVMHVVTRCREVLPASAVVVATSDQASDDPLALYLAQQGVPVVRGSLEDVFGRFLNAADEKGFEWFARISADSPLMRPDILRAMLPHARGHIDLVTNVLKRTFPPGHSVELIRTATMRSLATGRLTDAEREHVTKVFYNHPERFNIVSIENVDGASTTAYTVDTVDDFVRLEAEVRRGYSPPPLRTAVHELRAERQT